MFLNIIILGSPVSSVGKESACNGGDHFQWRRSLAMEEIQVSSPGQEDPLEKEMATHSSILFAWKIPWTEEPGGPQSIGSQESDMT